MDILFGCTEHRKSLSVNFIQYLWFGGFTTKKPLFYVLTCMNRMAMTALGVSCVAVGNSRFRLDERKMANPKILLAGNL